jgi:hypothetical protein
VAQVVEAVSSNPNITKIKTKKPTKQMNKVAEG